MFQPDEEIAWQHEHKLSDMNITFTHRIFGQRLNLRNQVASNTPINIHNCFFYLLALSQRLDLEDAFCCCCFCCFHFLNCIYFIITIIILFKFQVLSWDTKQEAAALKSIWSLAKGTAERHKISEEENYIYINSFCI